MRSSPSRKLIVVLCGGAVLVAIPPADGQPVLQGVPSSSMPAPVAAPATQAPAADISPGKGSAAPVADAAAQRFDTTAVAPDRIGAETAAPLSPPPEATPAELRRDLTPLGMFVWADIVVKVVMLGLVLASVLTWTIWLAKTFELGFARRSLALAQRALATARSLAEAVKPASHASPHVALLLEAVEAELHRSPDLRDIAGIKERIVARFERIEAGVGRQMMRATGILATIGATAPFVGLFGTVWGIMNSFIGISKLHTTNLAVVAPGIAEALLATAFGLAAAIPAVVIYNAFARSIANYRALYADACVEILTLVSRDLSQSQGADDWRVRAAAPTGTR
jgi:biopolymer transport protein ExbB